MVYEKLNLKDGTVLTEEHLAHIEDGIVSATKAATVSSVTLLADAWETNDSLHSQVVSIEGITERSQVNLTPSVQQLVTFYDRNLTFVTENENGVVTVYAIGEKPTEQLTIPVAISEVNV